MIGLCSTNPIWIGVGAVFLAATIWIHYQVKVESRGARSGESVRQLGSVKVQEPAPNFSARDLDGNEAVLDSFHGEKVVLLDFWATWCGPCRMAMPHLQTLHDNFKSHGLEILSVNLREPAPQVKQFIDKKKYTFRVVLDENGVISDQYGVRAIPTVVVVDKQGLVQWLQVGFSESKELDQLIKRLTKE